MPEQSFVNVFLAIKARRPLKLFWKVQKTGKCLLEHCSGILWRIKVPWGFPSDLRFPKFTVKFIAYLLSKPKNLPNYFATEGSEPSLN